MIQVNMNKRTCKKAHFAWIMLVLSIFCGVFLAKKVFPVKLAFAAPVSGSAENRQKAMEQLLSVAGSESVEEITRLIQEGANVNATDDGWTPLMLAVRYNGSPEVLKLLIEMGADVSIKDKEGKRALDYADENEGLKRTDEYNLLRQKMLSKTKIKEVLPC